MSELTIIEAPKRPFKRTLKRRPTTSPKPHKTTAKRKIKAKSISKLKKELEALQKQIVIKTYGNDCYTCNQKNLEGKNCQLGHVPWPRSALWVACVFMYRYTRIQCFHCNINCGGMGAVALDRMRAELGAEEVDRMKSFSDSHKGETVPRKWFEQQIESFAAKLKER